MFVMMINFFNNDFKFLFYHCALIVLPIDESDEPVTPPKEQGEFEIMDIITLYLCNCCCTN